jgi:serine/threonine protein kinase
MVIRGQYIVEGLLGRNSSCATYLVRDQRTRDAESNLFVLKEVVAPKKQGRRRRASESKSLRKLHHPGLPRVHRVLYDDKNSRVYLLMDCIAGEDLETLRQQQPVKLFPWPQVMTIIAPLLAAVTYLHDQRTPIIHGDIKPGNIIMSSEDTRIVLVDFGLSKVGDPPDLPTSADRHCYLAPEQYSGIIDVRTDIYALGATCYTLVTGKVPPDARSRLKQTDDEALDPLVPVNDIVPAVPTHVGKAIERAMSLDAQRRFSSVEQFREALWLMVGCSAPVFGVSPVLKDSPTVPTGGLERAVAVGQASEKPLSSPPVGGPAPESAEEPEDPDATIRLPKPPLVKRVRESAEKREDPGPDNSLPRPPSAGLAEMKEPEDLGAAKLLPRPSRDGGSSFSLGKPGVLFIELPLLLSLGIGAGFMSLAQSHSAVHPAPTQTHTASPAPTPTSAPAIQRWRKSIPALFTDPSAGKPPSFTRGMRAPFLVWGWGTGAIGWIIPGKIGIHRSSHNLCHG